MGYGKNIPSHYDGERERRPKHYKVVDLHRSPEEWRRMVADGREKEGCWKYGQTPGHHAEDNVPQEKAYPTIDDRVDGSSGEGD